MFLDIANIYYELPSLYYYQQQYFYYQVEDDDDSLEEEIKQSDEKEGDNLTKWSKSLTLEDLRQLQVKLVYTGPGQQQSP